MKALVLPRGKSAAELQDWPLPPAAEAAQTMLRTLEVGVCGTDRLLLEGIEGMPPQGENALVLGHEGLFEVVSSSAGQALNPGDLVVTSVRWPDPRPCAFCAAHRPDLCLTGEWVEHGIRGEHGFMREFWLAENSRLEIVPAGLRDIAVLLEPLSVVVKGLEMVTAVEATRPRRGGEAVVLGAGTVGILTAAGLILEGRSVRVVDRVSHDSRKSRILGQLGAEYTQIDDLGRNDELARLLAGADVVVEAAGTPQVLTTALSFVRANGTVLVLGTGEHAWPTTVDLNAVARALVQENKTILGSVNASPEHLRRAIGVLDAMAGRWPGVLQSSLRRFPASEFAQALSPAPDAYVKAVISFE
ncbi:zinc-binding dehydrogenase [Nonomuraea sp. NBC_01738]|uniref:zinc-binding dehydrogenase n=1 Tax=Nonomuraea sp. NBC_01738 TaxID=2976003 RepID=UPI002E1595C9|nr:zinc-binding dehydrogenase [Nonomuraea sp. NBC_01738]